MGEAVAGVLRETVTAKADARAARLDRRPLVCLVTDRRRLSPDTTDHRRLDDLVALVEASAEADVDLVQVRERDLSGRALATLVERCRKVVERTATRLVVNERLDVALATGAAGVHLRETSCEAARVRAIVAPAFLVGLSTHEGAVSVAAPAPEDYTIFGAVFPTVSKPEGRRPTGGARLAEAVRQSRAPLLAIGGITVDRLDVVWRAGAAGIAGIGLFVDAARAHADWSTGLRALVDRVRRSFDTP